MKTTSGELPKDFLNLGRGGDCSNQPGTSGSSCRSGFGVEQSGPGSVLLWQPVIQNGVLRQLMNENATVVIDM